MWAQTRTLTSADTGPLLKCLSDPDLVSSGGKVGWDTEAEARKVLEAQLASSSVIVAEVKQANAKAVAPGKIAADAAAELAEKAGKGLDAGLPVIGTVAGIVAVVAGAWAAWKIFGK